MVTLEWFRVETSNSEFTGLPLGKKWRAYLKGNQRAQAQNSRKQPEMTGNQKCFYWGGFSLVGGNLMSDFGQSNLFQS